jgi:hypothetical protein
MEKCLEMVIPVEQLHPGEEKKPHPGSSTVMFDYAVVNLLYTNYTYPYSFSE